MPERSSRSALILVDLQNDFLPGGALAVRDGDAVLPVANRWLQKCDLAVATQDWHPPNHLSFAANHPGKKIGDEVEIEGHRQKLWPAHCLADTPGAALADALDMDRITHVVKKGTDPQVDSYSAFFDNSRLRGTGLEEYLREQGVETVYLLGLATDYCVKATALDAVKLGFHVKLIEEGCRGVNLVAGDVARALADMREAGVEMIHAAGPRAAAALDTADLVAIAEARKPPLPFWRTVARSCRLVCPRCGRGKLFDGWFRMRHHCDACGLDLWQEPGFYLGSIYFNYGLTALVVTISYFAFYFGGTVDSTLGSKAVLSGLTAYCIVFPLWFFRYARSLWLGFDQYWDPD